MIFESNTISLVKVSDGQDGVGQYVHIMYSDVENPQSPGDISTVPLDYMGICINNSPIAPTDPGQYTWSKIKGDDGRPGATGRPGQPGQDGATYYIHIKWSNDGGQTFSEGTGAWLGVYTDTSPEPIEIPMLYQWTRVAGTDGTVISLSNESHTVPTDSNGLSGNYVGAETIITVYEGKTDTTSLWNISYIESNGVSGTFSNNKYILTEIIEDTGYVDFTATREGYSKLTKRFQIARTKSGESAMTYKLLCEPTVIHKDNSGNLSTGEIILSAKSYTDISNNNYLGHFKVTADNNVIYESSKDESAAVVKIPNTSVQIKAELYTPSKELLDSQSVTIVTDGQHGTNGKTYSLNIKGDTTTVIYDHTGKNPMPQTVRPFSAELYENGKLITSNIEYSWGSKSIKSVFSGISTGPTFIPTLSPTYNIESQYENAIVLMAKYAGQVLYAAQPVIVQQSAKPGENTISAILSNETHVIPTDSDGSSGNYTGASTTVTIYEGTKDVSVAWSIKAIASEGITGTLSDKTYTVTEMTTDSGYVEFTCSRNGYPDIVKRFQLSRVKSGSTGASGEAAATYWLLCSSNVAYKSLEGKITPSVVTITGKTQKGNEPVASYGCRFKISVNDKVVYTSTTDETLKEYTLPLDAKNISIEMYASGGTSVLLDQQNVQVLTDGKPGKGVASVDVMYYKSSSAVSLADGEWSTENPGWENGKYIWSKTVVTYSDKTTEETTPVCITGSAGETGKGIKFIIEEYYKSTSSVELKGGSWQSTYPGWESDKFIWTRSTIEYSDNTSKTTDPICVSGSKGVDGSPGYTVYLTNQYETFLCNSLNEIVKESAVSTKAMAYRGSEELTCTIGEIATIPGMSTLVTGNMITFTALKGTELAEQGTVEIPVIADEKNFTVSFSWSKIVDASGDLEEIKTSITEVKNITDNLNERIELSVTKTEFNNANAAIKQDFSRLDIELGKITSEVSSMGSGIAANSTKIEQTDKKLSLIATGDGESGITLTPNFITLVSENIGIKAQNLKIDALTTFMNSATSGDKTVINGGAIDTVSLTAKIIEAQILKSKNYKEKTDPNSPYSIEGTFYNLETGDLISKNFAIDNKNGNVFMRGTVHATNGSFTGKVTGSTIEGTAITGGTINGTTITGVNISGGSSITCGEKFKVTADGTLTAVDAVLSGKITAKTGSIGGFTIGNNSLYSTNVEISPTQLKYGNSFIVTPSGGLTATGANITGTITATSGSFKGTITASSGSIGGFNISENGLVSGYVKITPTILTYGNNFKVDSDGKLTASGADLSGKISATSGTIGSFSIAYSETNQYNDAEHAYANTLYRIVRGSDGYDYQAGIKAESTTKGETEAAFYIRKKLRSSTWANSSLPFYVRNNGYAYVEHLRIGGNLYMETNIPEYIGSNDSISNTVVTKIITSVPNAMLNGANDISFGNIGESIYMKISPSISLEDKSGIQFYIGGNAPFVTFSYNNNQRAYCLYPSSGKTSYLGTDNKKWDGIYSKSITLGDKTIYSWSDVSEAAAIKASDRLISSTNSSHIGQLVTINNEFAFSKSTDGNTGCLGRNTIPWDRVYTRRLNIGENDSYVDFQAYDYNGLKIVASNTIVTKNGNGFNTLSPGLSPTPRTIAYVNTNDEAIFSDNNCSKTYIRGKKIYIGNQKYIGNDKTKLNLSNVISSGNNIVGTTAYIGVDENGDLCEMSGSPGNSYSAGTGISISGNTISVKPNTYASYNHTHTGYASSNHSHSGYASSGHTHSEYATKSYGILGKMGIYTSNTSCIIPTSGAKHIGHINARWESGYFSNQVIAKTLHGTLAKTSDRNYKTDIKEYDLALESFYMNIRPVSYKLKNLTKDDNHTKTHYGYVYQEIEEEINKNGIACNDCAFLIKTRLDEPNIFGSNEEYGLDYTEFISLNTHMTQKAHHRIDAQEQEIQELKNSNLQLQGEISILKQQLQELKNLINLKATN